MKKKMLSLIVITAMLVTMLAGCGSKSSEGKNGELNIFIWTEYVPDSVIEKFEKETGIKVNVSTYSSNEDMLAKVKSESEGTYDIVQPSDYMVEQMASQGMLEELKTDELKNLSNIGESYLNPSYDPGNKYSVPYQGGVAGIAVNTSKVKKDITSYDDLFDSSLKNSIVALDDYRAVIGMTARSMGYSMNETDPAVLSKIQDKLLTLKNNVKLYDSDSPKSALISGDCTVGYVWSAEIALAMEENPDIKVVYPTEGAYLFMDNWAIPKGAKNYDNAMKFIDFMLDAENAQMVLEEFPYLSPNTKAVEAMGEDYSKNEAKNPPTEVIKKGEYVKNLDADTLKIYDEMWTKLKQ
ncbi:ABC transporter substrate-binding protein [Anaerobutyricum soehngenii]|uniref:ABC transporter substrate-binding protein n=1 Tax=Anaerobutyricum soehngenii TaxID=105843 RepID=UPI001C125411|nr:spermidine/putrescine ABC transporter substrate-binding protein [Anaerobutyricum soehngenii]MBU5415997.1 spermidine/putrescine ABC transporter substrate-binding protein [Anaerobutyricum soehngenii]